MKVSEKTYGKFKLADLDQAMAAEDLEKAVEVAKVIFEVESPVSDAVLGCYDRVLCYEEESDQMLAHERLVTAREIARTQLKSAEAKVVFDVYDRVFGDIE